MNEFPEAKACLLVEIKAVFVCALTRKMAHENSSSKTHFAVEEFWIGWYTELFFYKNKLYLL